MNYFTFCFLTQLYIMTQVPGGWKPGAISKRLLRKLNKVKIYQANDETAKPVKKLRKRVENKPTLIISKKGGEYRVEMQATPEKDTGVDYNPMVYKIANEGNIEKQSRKERQRKRVIRKAIEEVWSDPYNPEDCEKMCYRAYQQAIGVLPYDPNNPECICSDEENAETDESCSCEDNDASSCSSSDVEWEIHFSPPIAHHL